MKKISNLLFCIFCFVIVLASSSANAGITISFNEYSGFHQPRYSEYYNENNHEGHFQQHHKRHNKWHGHARHATIVRYVPVNTVSYRPLRPRCNYHRGWH